MDQFILAVETPGTSVKGNVEDRPIVERDIRALKTHFFDANIALNLFLDSKYFPTAEEFKQAMHVDYNQLQQVSAVVMHEKGWNDHEDHEKIRYEAEIRLKGIKWAKEGPPMEFRMRKQHVAAQSFVSALDFFDRQLGVLARDITGVDMQPVLDEMKAAFPGLRAVRNSLAHQYERNKLVKDRNKKIDLKPIANGIINDPYGVTLIMGFLNGTQFTTTLEDGTVGTVDVTMESLTNLREILRMVIGSFDWYGPPQHEPR